MPATLPASNWNGLAPVAHAEAPGRVPRRRAGRGGAQPVQPGQVLQVIEHSHARVMLPGASLVIAFLLGVSRVSL